MLVGGGCVAVTAAAAAHGSIKSPQESRIRMQVSVKPTLHGRDGPHSLTPLLTSAAAQSLLVDRGHDDMLLLVHAPLAPPTRWGGTIGQTCHNQSESRASGQLCEFVPEPATKHTIIVSVSSDRPFLPSCVTAWAWDNKFYLVTRKIRLD
jgi:hypothetical protein